MKFVRIGPLTLQKQVQYKEPETDMWPHYPPRKKGFFAFPAGYVDHFFLPLGRPPEDPHSLQQYLRDDDGNRITGRDLFDQESSTDDTDAEQKTLSVKGRELLKKRNLKIKQIIWLKRPSWVMVYPDPDKDLTFYGIHTENEDRSRLNQPLEFLLDPKGNKIKAIDFFSRYFRYKKFPQNYEGCYEPPIIDKDILSNDFYYPDGRIITVAQWLLCWP